MACCFENHSKNMERTYGYGLGRLILDVLMVLGTFEWLSRSVHILRASCVCLVYVYLLALLFWGCSTTPHLSRCNSVFDVVLGSPHR